MFQLHEHRPRIAAVYCVYHDDIWLTTSVASIYPAVDKIYFLVSSIPWNGPKTDNRSTLDCINTLEDPDHKIDLIRGNWHDQVTQRSSAMNLLSSHAFDYMMVVDADEIYDTSQLLKAIELVQRYPDVDAWHMCWITYWKSIDYCIDPMEDYFPPIFLRVGHARFHEFRNVLAEKNALIPPRIAIVHHLSYARSDELVLRKINSISAAPQISKNWFENVWKRWDKNQHLTDLHPVRPQQFKRAVLTRPYQLPPLLANNPKFLGPPYASIASSRTAQIRPKPLGPSEATKKSVSAKKRK